MTPESDALRAHASDRERATEFDQDIADRICTLMIQGLSLTRICRIRGMPTLHRVVTWRRERSDFAMQFELARRDRADTRADKIDALSDSTTMFNWQARRVQIDAQKWSASKDNSARYGDKVLIGLPGLQPRPSEVPTLEAARRVAFALAKGAELVKEQRQPRAPLLLEGKGEVVLAPAEGEETPLVREGESR